MFVVWGFINPEGRSLFPDGLFCKLGQPWALRGSLWHFVYVQLSELFLD